MTEPITERAYLVSLGLAKEGVRGRFSVDGRNALAAARDKGMAFVDAKAKVADVTVTDDNGTVKTVKRVVNEWAPHAESIVSDKRWTVNHPDSPKPVTVSPSEACKVCGFSLGWCYCDVGPTITGWYKGWPHTVKVDRTPYLKRKG